MTFAKNIFNLAVWTNREWEIYFYNLDELCKIHKLKKQQLSAKIKINNLYRKAATRPRNSTISRICEKFGVTNAWLSRKPEYMQVKEDDTNYNLGGGWEPRNLDKLTNDPAMSQAMVLLAKIYDTKDSNTIRHAYNLLKSTYENFGEKNEEKQG